MNRELQDYYEYRADMMASQGWRDLIADVKEMKVATDRVSAVKDANDLHFRKGELSIMEWILGLQQMSEQAYQQLKDDDETAKRL